MQKVTIMNTQSSQTTPKTNQQPTPPRPVKKAGGEALVVVDGPSQNEKDSMPVDSLENGNQKKPETVNDKTDLLKQLADLLEPLPKKIEAVDTVYRTGVRPLLVRIDKEEAYKPKHKSNGAMFKTLFKEHKTTLHRQLKAGKVELSLNQTIGHNRESVMRPLGRLLKTPDKLKKAYAAASETAKASNSSLTAKIIAEAAKTVSPPKKKATKAKITPPVTPKDLIKQISDNTQVLGDDDRVKLIMSIVESNFSAEKESLEQLRTLLEDIATQAA
jgi:hypothetical protein